MESIIDTIRRAVANDASAEVRAAGAQACRTILAALDARRGEPLASALAADAHAGSAATLQTLVGALRTMPLDQLIDFAIAKLSAALPQGTTAPSVLAVQIPIVPVRGIGGAHERS